MYNPTFPIVKHHVLNLFVLQTPPPIAPPIAQLPLSSKFLIFLLPSLLHSCPPASLSYLVSVVFSSLVIVFICLFSMRNLVITFLLSVRHYCTVCVRAAWYGSFHTRGLQYRSYHGWCFTTVSSACTTPVHAAWYGSFRTPVLPYSSIDRTTILLVHQTTAPYNARRGALSSRAPDFGNTVKGSVKLV